MALSPRAISVKLLREQFGPGPLIVTLRDSASAARIRTTKKRVKTPAEAIQDGSDMLVVGRPIWGALNPKAAAEAILEEIALAVE